MTEKVRKMRRREFGQALNTFDLQLTAWTVSAIIRKIDSKNVSRETIRVRVRIKTIRFYGSAAVHMA